MDSSDPIGSCRKVYLDDQTSKLLYELKMESNFDLLVYKAMIDYVVEKLKKVVEKQ